MLHSLKIRVVGFNLFPKAIRLKQFLDALKELIVFHCGGIKMVCLGLMKMFEF